MIKYLTITLIIFCFSVTETSAKTSLPLPRFVSIKSTEANVRTGPGLRYKIKWVYKRKKMPLEVVAEFEQWRKVRDIQGDEGWIHRSQLTNKRGFLITGEDQIMRRSSEKESRPIAKLEQGVVGDLESCNFHYCKVRTGSYKGWVKRKNIWGVYPDEIID